MNLKLNIDFESLDKNAIYCLDCLREGIVEPIYDYVKHCKHAHRNIYTYRFCKNTNEWHMFRAFTSDVKCATCLIKIANTASHTPEANAARERTMIANGEAAKRNKRITDKDLKKKIFQRQKEKGEGFWNSELQKENSMKSIAKQRATMTGIFDPNIRAANQIAMKEKKIGIYNPAVQKKSIDSQKENGTGFYNHEISVRAALNSVETQRKNGIGIVGMWLSINSGKATEEQLKLRDKILGNLIHIGRDLIFDRDAFYASDLDLVSFKVNGDSDRNMSLSEFVNKYNKVGSVIARNLYSSDDCFICCLDVAKTNGTSGELSWFQRTMKTAKEQKNLSIEELSTLSNPYIRLKRRKYLEEMEKYPGSKIVSEVVFAFDHPVEANSEEEKYLLDVEIQYAHDNKALFWNN